MPALVFLLSACGDTPKASNDAGPDVATFDASDESEADAVKTDAAEAGEAGPVAALRIMAANLTSSTQQQYEDFGIRIFQGLHPDIVLIQEFNYPAGDRALVDAAFGTEFSFYVEPTGSIPNGVVSRYPILDSGTWTDASTTDRAFVWARIDVPGPTDLWAVSLHLLTSGATERDTEAKQVVMYVQANVPPGDFLVIGGDFNTNVTNEAAIVDLSASVVASPPFPADQNANAFTSINRNRPHDWVLANAGLQALAIPLVIGSSTYASGLVFDSRVYTPLAEVAPVMMTDSAANQMQHMPVVRDFNFATN